MYNFLQGLNYFLWEFKFRIELNTDRSPVGNPVGNQISGKNLFVRIKFLKKIYLAYKNKNAYRIQISYRVFSETFNNQKKSFSY